MAGKVLIKLGLNLKTAKAGGIYQFFVTPWTIGHQAPLSMGFPRPAYWSGFPFPSPGDLPDPGIEPGLLHCRWILYLSYQGSSINAIETY